MPATASPPRSSREPAVPRALERRLFVSYLLVFSALLVAFALVIHVSYVSSLKAQMDDRLDILLSTGVRSVYFTGTRFTIRQNLSPTSLLARGQGLEWFDARRNRVATEGLVPDQKHLPEESSEVFQIGPSQQLQARVTPIVNPRTGATIGWVRASQSLKQMQSEAWQLDVILIIGLFVALAASTLGARYLQVRSVAPIRASYERLREFSADASHELRGPITAVNSNADAALRDAGGMRETDRERFAAIAQAAGQMRRLTEDLLLLARAEQSLEHEIFVVDLGAIVRNLGALYAADFERQGVEFRNRVRENAHVYGNPDQIERILANLVENALRYTPAGGSVTIDSTQDRRHVHVNVTDTGSGIGKEHLDKIFDRFWRSESARSRTSGTGLGLAIAKALARRHGGDVTVTSRPGAGSRFTVTFPLRPPT